MNVCNLIMTGVLWLGSHCLAAAVPMVENMPDFLPVARNRSAAFYYPPVGDEDVKWFSNFKVFVPGRLEPSANEFLNRYGVKLVFYDWATGFYDHNAEYAAVAAEILNHHPDWVLNPGNPGPNHMAPERLEAYYYDMAVPELRQLRIDLLSEKLRAKQYNGVFFDCTGFGSVWETGKWLCRSEFERRHPDLDYDDEARKFYRGLAAANPGCIIFLNQSYHQAEKIYSVADYDLTESLMVTQHDGPVVEVFVEGEGVVKSRETNYRPVAEIISHCENFNRLRAQYNPELVITHLNYMCPFLEPTGEKTGSELMPQAVYRRTMDRQAIHFAQAVTALVGQQQYTNGDGTPHLFQADPVYLLDLGEPSGEYRRVGQCLVRNFANGFVVVNPEHSAVNLPLRELLPARPDRLYKIYDAFNEAMLPDELETLTIPAGYYPASRRHTPSGRLFFFVCSDRFASGDRVADELAFARTVLENSRKLPADVPEEAVRRLEQLLDSWSALRQAATPSAGAYRAFADALIKVYRQLEAWPVTYAWQREGGRALGRAADRLAEAIAERFGVEWQVTAGAEDGEWLVSAVPSGAAAAEVTEETAYIVELVEPLTPEAEQPSRLTGRFAGSLAGLDRVLLAGSVTVNGVRLPLLRTVAVDLEPPVAVRPRQPVIFAPSGTVDTVVEVVNRTGRELAFRPEWQLPAGWQLQAPATLAIPPAGLAEYPVTLTLPPDAPLGDYRLQLTGALRGGAVDQAVAEEVIVRRIPQLMIRFAGEPVTCDGEAAETVWRRVPAVQFGEAAGGAGRTTVRCAYDDAYFYCLLQCERPERPYRETVAEQDGPVWEDDGIEIELDCSNMRSGGYRCVVNTAGVVYQDNVPGNTGLRPRIGVRKHAGGYDVEVGIPYQALAVMGRPVDGSAWALNFRRREQEGGKEKYSDWSGRDEPASWGQGIFSPALKRDGWQAAASRRDDVAGNLLDGRTETRWDSGALQERGMEVVIDLGAPQTFNAVRLLIDDVGDTPACTEVAISADGQTYRAVGELRKDDSGSRYQYCRLPDEVTARLVKLTLAEPTSEQRWWSINEFDLLQY